MLPVGTLKPNDWGLFDIFGNALEWCQDLALFYATDHAWTGDSEQLENVSDSRWRVLRGGAFYYRAHDVRSAFRYETLAPMDRAFACGFRVARTYPPTVP
jgi:formylglycine-generating enzyme required for sulfatase activity